VLPNNFAIRSIVLYFDRLSYILGVEINSGLRARRKIAVIAVIAVIAALLTLTLLTAF
jgi:hypothetical protein